MSVYVDDMQAEFRGMIMCHMIADSTAELLQMVDKIGVQRKWIQYPGSPKEHFDICLSKRTLAIKHGAIEIEMRQLAAMEMRRIVTGRLGNPSDAYNWLDRYQQERSFHVQR